MPFINESFDIEGNTYHFKIDSKTQEPIKLGDGTFGIVFEIEKKNQPKEKYAVKLLYDLGLSDARYQAEINA